MSRAGNVACRLWLSRPNQPVQFPDLLRPIGDLADRPSGGRIPGAGARLRRGVKAIEPSTFRLRIDLEVTAKLARAVLIRPMSISYGSRSPISRPWDVQLIGSSSVMRMDLVRRRSS